MDSVLQDIDAANKKRSSIYAKLSEKDRIILMTTKPHVKASAFNEAFLVAKENYKKMNPLKRAVQTFVGKIPNRSWWIKAQAKYMINQHANHAIEQLVRSTEIAELVAISEGKTEMGDFDRNRKYTLGDSVMEKAEEEWFKR